MFEQHVAECFDQRPILFDHFLGTLTLLLHNFGNSIKMIDLIVLSGNWWTPALKPAVLTNFARLANGSFSLQLIAEPQFTNRIEASTNFANWTSLLTTSPLTTSVSFVDTQAASLPQRFYRSR